VNDVKEALSGVRLGALREVVVDVNDVTGGWSVRRRVYFWVRHG
jgi:hypothetical protein